MQTPEQEWGPASEWLDVAERHPMTGDPVRHTLAIDRDRTLTVTLHLWQWVRCADQGECQSGTVWRLLEAPEPGTTATGRLATAMVTSYRLLQARWGPGTPGWDFAIAVESALIRGVFSDDSPPDHPYATPKCTVCG